VDSTDDGAKRGIGVFEVKDAQDAGDVDSVGDESGDAGDSGEVFSAVAPRATIGPRRCE
jgi:hypothetical protein